MKEQYVTYKIALTLKELSFDEKSKFGQETSLYDKNGNHIFYSNYGFMGSGLGDNYIYAPLWQQVIDWFREKHDIYIDIYTIKESSGPHYYFNIFIKDDIMKLTNFKVCSNINYYYIREQAILKAIEICQKRK